jgi:hypothetical protein
MTATQQLARLYSDCAAGLRPYRAYNRFALFWIVARVLAATDATVTVRWMHLKRTSRAAITRNRTVGESHGRKHAIQ